MEAWYGGIKSILLKNKASAWEGLYYADHMETWCHSIDECFLENKFKLLDNRNNSVVILMGPRQANLVLIAYASSEGSGEWLGMHSWNLSWRNARRHKFAWRGRMIFKLLCAKWKKASALQETASLIFFSLLLKQLVIDLMCHVVSTYLLFI